MSEPYGHFPWPSERDRVVIHRRKQTLVRRPSSIAIETYRNTRSCVGCVVDEEIGDFDEDNFDADGGEIELEDDEAEGVNDWPADE